MAISNGRDECPFNISEVELTKNASFVGAFCGKLRDGSWANLPMYVFYVAEPEQPHFSNYFALFVDYMGRCIITDGASAVSEPIAAIESADGEIVYSQYRHDFRWTKDGTAAIDGGRDYTKITGRPYNMVTLNVVDGEILVSRHVG